MTYPEILAHIYGLARFGMKPGLERISPLLGKLGNPHQRIRAVHVVGTNGKGSTAAFLSTAISAGGYRTGLFTSPHLISFTERIRIDGETISEDVVVQLAGEVLHAASRDTTFFEIVTALGLLYFARQGVDVAVLEAGMGGRQDATNVVAGIMTVVTPISLDHCDYLGATVAEIALEKAGIVTPGTPAIVAPQPPEALEVIRRSCAAQDSPLFLSGEHFSSSWGDAGLDYRGLSLSLDGLQPGIPGRYQAGNAACALCCAELLNRQGFVLDEGTLRRGIESARWPGRMELIGAAPRFLLDGAHNAAGGTALAEAIPDLPRDRLILVAGVMGDKDAEGILAPLLPLADVVVAVTPAVARAMPADDLAMLCRRAGGTCMVGGAVADGLAVAAALATANDLVVVCGSLFTVGEARAILLGGPFQPCRG